MLTTDRVKLVVHWPRFGPLHLNRLRAAHEVLGRAGIEVVALEVAATSAVYDWRVERGPTPFPRITLFPGHDYDALTPADLHRAMWAALDRIGPGAVHIHSYSTPDARAALAWCRTRRRAALCMAESRAEDSPRSGWREAVKRTLVREFDAAQAAGSAAARYAVDLGVPRERIAIGYSVVDNDYFARTAAAVRRDPASVRHLPGLADPAPFFFASARFMARKDLPTLLRAYGTYRARQPDPWRLVLLGDGALRPELEALVVHEHIGGVEMPGWRQIEDLPAYYALAGAFVHTATVDQWGLVVNEAMAAGLPVVVSTGAGCAEDLVRDGENGFTFAPGDADTLARYLGAVAHEVDRAAFSARSVATIAEWPLERFGESLLAAARLGLPHADRPFDPRARALIAGLRVLARSPRAFHSVED